MGYGVLTRRLGGLDTSLRRLSVGAAAAVLLVLAVPAPAAAAPTPSVTITDVTVAEGTGGAVNASFTIQVATHPRSCCPLQVSWATAPGSAAATTDYTTSSGNVSLTKTSFSRVVSVPVASDATDEPDETFVVNLSNLVGTPGKIGDAQGVATITDDDLPPSLSVDDVAITEGDAGTTTATFTASLAVVSGKTVTLDWSTSAGSATVGVDYTAASGSETIAVGSTGATIGVTVNGDVLDEVDESFGITLSNPGNATIADGSGVATITDDDPFPLLSVGDGSITEGNAGTANLTFDITLSSASSKTVTVDWATADDSAIQPDDYNAGSGTVTFTPGGTSETIDVSVNGDIVAELDETFLVVLSSPSEATLGDAQGVGTIDDDELLPVIDIDDPSVTEGPSGTATLSFSVTLSNLSASIVTVDWSTAAGTATSGTDYADANGTVTFAPLETSQTVQITVNGDGIYERGETITLLLSNPTGAPIGDSQGIGTIVNDDAAPVVSVADVSVLEGNAGTSVLTFGVSLTGDSELDASLDFATTNATATGGVDYVATSGTLTIPAGATTGTVDVVVNGDLMYESNETFSLLLSNPADASIGDGAAQGTIMNDDRAPTAVSLKVVRKSRTILAKGILEPTKSGHRVTATLFRKQNGKFLKIAAKTVLVRYLKDRDGDGRKDGSYSAKFLRPKAAGTYKVLVRFKGTSTHKPCSRAQSFTLGVI